MDLCEGTLRPADGCAYNALLETLRFVCKVTEGVPAASQISFGLNVQWHHCLDLRGVPWVERTLSELVFGSLDELLIGKLCPFKKIKIFRNNPDADEEWEPSPLDTRTRELLPVLLPKLNNQNMLEIF